MCAKVPKATNRQNNNSADESMTGKKLKTTMDLDSTDLYHVVSGSNSEDNSLTNQESALGLK